MMIPMRRLLTSRRTLVGLALVVVSLVGVGLVIQESAQTRVIAVASGALVAGQVLSPSDVEPLTVPDSAVFDAYATMSDADSVSILTRSVSPGEFIPREILGTDQLSDDSVVTIELSIGQPEWLVAGARAELWVSPAAAENSFLAPFVLAPEVTLVRVAKDEGFAADSVTTRVDLLVPRRHMPGVVHALANRYFIHLSPASDISP